MEDAALKMASRLLSLQHDDHREAQREQPRAVN